MKILVYLPDELSDKIHARVKLSTAEVYDLLACIVNGTVIDDAEKGATNGDMIKAMFPFVTKYITCNERNIYIDSPIQACVYKFDRNWWNAPYKGGE